MIGLYWDFVVDVVVLLVLILFGFTLFIVLFLLRCRADLSFGASLFLRDRNVIVLKVDELLVR